MTVKYMVIAGKPKCTPKKALKKAYKKFKKIGSYIKKKLMQQTEDCLCDTKPDGYVKLKESQSSAEIFTHLKRKV